MQLSSRISVLAVLAVGVVALALWQYRYSRKVVEGLTLWPLNATGLRHTWRDEGLAFCTCSVFSGSGQTEVVTLHQGEARWRNKISFRTDMHTHSLLHCDIVVDKRLLCTKAISFQDILPMADETNNPMVIEMEPQTSAKVVLTLRFVEVKITNSFAKLLNSWGIGAVATAAVAWLRPWAMKKAKTVWQWFLPEFAPAAHPAAEEGED